jgi:sulfite exporter TauE/SafE
MAGFGLGTLPALITMGMAGSRLLAWRNRPRVRYTAAVVLVGLAVAALWHGLGMGAHAMSPMH